ncbi:MAG: ankyrin repeat domain-containing protein [Clostridiales bacterium]|nr:ankyrin repeat domain-containing protein [Clostridiales bacterium]
MKKLFNAIRKSNINEVKSIISNKPELVNCVAKQPPKKDDGQSPLQVALKTGNFEIAEYLIDMGADLNFMEDITCCNSWRTPVVHDAINAAVMNCRWNTNNKYSGFEVFSTKQKAETAYNILKKMIAAGADLNKLDSYGNSAIWRFCLQAAQILPSYNYKENFENDDRVFTNELEEDLSKILKLLCEYGADLNYVSPNTKTTVVNFYKYGSMAKLLKNIIG